MTLDLYTHLSKERENKQRIQLVEFLDSWLKTDHEDNEKDENTQASKYASDHLTTF